MHQITGMLGQHLSVMIRGFTNTHSTGVYVVSKSGGGLINRTTRIVVIYWWHLS